MDMSNSTGVLIVIDDDPAARKGVAALASSMEIECETYASAEEFLTQCRLPSVGCLLIDLRLEADTCTILILTEKKDENIYRDKNYRS